MAGWLDALLGRIYSSGVGIALSKGLNFTGGLSAVLNSSTKVVDVSVASAALTPTQLAIETLGVGIPFVLRIPMTAGTPGTTDDVAGPAAPFACRIIDRWADVTTAIALSTIQVQDASGGSGNTLSGSISSATTGEGRRATSGSVGTQATLAASEPTFVRRSDRGVAGAVYLLCVRT